MKKILSVVLVTVLLIACTSQQANQEAQIQEQEDSLFSDENKMVDKQRANDLIASYLEYSNSFPESTKSPEFLFKAGDMAMNLNMPQKAIEVFNRIINEYPDYEKAPQCLFLKGYVYENNMNNLREAKRIYEEFLLKYPNDEFADDAEVSIRNLGKSPEELIKEFEENAKAEAEDGGNI